MGRLQGVKKVSDTFSLRAPPTALGFDGRRATKMMPKAEQIRQFNMAGNMPMAWGLAADSLLAAAGILKDRRDRYDPRRLKVGNFVPDGGKILFPELMLRGFAVECLLKGLYVKARNTLASGGKYVGVKGAGDHNLLQLAIAVRFALTPPQKDVLKRLSIIMVGAGRYPITKDWSLRKIQKAFRGGKGPQDFWCPPGDDRTLATLVDLLERQLHARGGSKPNNALRL